MGLKVDIEVVVEAVVEIVVVIGSGVVLWKIGVERVETSKNKF